MDVVVDYADVLHEGIHTRGPDEAVPLRLQLLGERFGLRRRRGEARERLRCTLAGGLVGLGERAKPRRRCCRVEKCAVAGDHNDVRIADSVGSREVNCDVPTQSMNFSQLASPTSERIIELDNIDFGVHVRCCDMGVRCLADSRRGHGCRDTPVSCGAVPAAWFPPDSSGLTHADIGI